MIQQIKIKNFLSFKDEVTFSFEASKDRFAEESQVVCIDENTRLLRFAVIYGYNASGKSNLLKAFEFLTDFWTSKPNNMDLGTGVIPFKLDRTSANVPSYFELLFFVDNTKYCYQLELDQYNVYLEKLSYYDSTQCVMLFERTLKDGSSYIQFNPEKINVSDTARDMIQVNCLKNSSFFVARSQVNVSLPKIDTAKDWMRKYLMPVILPTTDLTAYAQEKALHNRELMDYIVKFLHEADFNVTDITSDVVSRQLSDNEVRTTFEHTVENNNGTETFLMDKSHESTGTMRTFGLETAVYYALNNEALLPIDELETSLHPLLLEKILFEYLKTPARSQLIVTTHNDGLLDLLDDLIRRDSVWFTEKQRTGITELYKLTDFKGQDRLSSIREAYRNKRFGATMS